MDPMMFKAARDGNVVDLFNLLEADPLILERLVTASADTPLHVAAMLGHLDFVKEVIKHKSNVVEYVKELNQQGFSPMHLAAAHGHVDVVRRLIEISSELCCLKGRDGMTPLHCASVKGRAETMNLLLSASPLCVLEVTERGETALHIAVKNNQLDALRVLVEWLWRSKTLVVINSKDGDGNTVLHLAAARKNHQAIELLLSCNDGVPEVLEVNAINKKGLTAMDLLMLCPCESGIVPAEAERLFRGIGAARDRVSDHITSTPRPYHNHNQVSYQKNPLAGHTNIVARSISSRQDTMLGMNTGSPGGTTSSQSISTWGQHEASDKFEMIWASRNRILVSFYALSNTIGFFVSLDMILVLTSKFPMCWGLVVAVHAIAVNYTISIVGITPSGGMKIASAVLCITLLLAIRLTSRCIRTRSRWRLHRSSAERLARYECGRLIV
ncbi:Ankyrin repeat-containing protein BDA1 [Vitis vinifera]|uniref:Ankyrin repeat-containing protein BDA1 n=1 Tax=Vitis vinifera TaxID=29760 RepID=A0A438K2E4_VITVI|nr:Ankyrin repeat-containing protein BDA1 [Vitis vinifera]